MHCKAWRGDSWCYSWDLAWDSRAHCWQQWGPLCSRVHARQHSIDCMHFTAAGDIDPAHILFLPSYCTRILAGTKINEKKSRKYSILCITSHSTFMAAGQCHHEAITQLLLRRLCKKLCFFLKIASQLNCKNKLVVLTTEWLPWVQPS